jgi:hypothetical protein
MSFLPSETDSVLIIDADAVLARTTPAQRLEAVAGEYPKLMQALDPVQLRELAPHNGPESRYGCRRRRGSGAS